MELTYLTYTCRAANLKWFLRDEQVSSSVREMIEVYEAVKGEDRRGTRLRESEFFLRGKEPVATQLTPLPDESYRLLAATLNTTSGSAVYTAPIEGAGSAEGTIPLSNQATFLSSLQLHGVMFKSFDQSPRDSCVSFRPTGTPMEGAGHIMAIFTHTRCTAADPPASTTETFLLVKPFEELSVDDVRHDHYRQYQWAGGLLYYDTFLPPVIVRPEQIICHAAKTPLRFGNIERPCVHILPLNRVSNILTCIYAMIHL